MGRRWSYYNYPLVVGMSTSLLKKSLELFDEEGKTDRTKSNKGRPARTIVKNKQATLKDRKVKSALESYTKKNRKEDRTLGNLAVLEKISLKNSVSQDSANKILKYHLQKSRKVVEAEPKKEAEKSVFTDEDFRKFQQEYFVKGKI